MGGLIMKKEELQRIVEYVNQKTRDYIKTNCSALNEAIRDGFFKEEEFINKCIVD